MFKLRVMGHMKSIEQMIRDGSFDSEFMPSYQKAIDTNQRTFKFAGQRYGIDYGRAVVNFVIKIKTHDLLHRK
jgi:hypothetical protein